ncbi:hypothetical protein OS176_05355 [Xanthomonadaceae bacterium XH05]|nr:hypothetical protein [Xanthomonadaceae bacterium XH05]
MSLARRLWAAFVARPFGMPIPPNFFYLAAMGLLGAFVSPGFWVLGAGFEIGYLFWLANNRRFRATLEADEARDDPAERRYHRLWDTLTTARRERQRALEQRARDIVGLLDADPMMRTHIDSIEQLVWLHLRMLSADQAIAQVLVTASEESGRLQQQEDAIAARLARADLDAELRRSLEQQKQVIDARQAAHAQAGLRAERIEAELARIDQQVALIREQALLSGDEQRIGTSLDALTSAFNEADRWLDSQRDLIGALDLDDHASLPPRVLRGSVSSTPQRVSQGVSR